MCPGGENGFDLPVAKGQGRPLSQRSATADRVRGLGPAALLPSTRLTFPAEIPRLEGCLRAARREEQVVHPRAVLSAPSHTFCCQRCHQQSRPAASCRRKRLPGEEAAQRAAKPGAERSV